MNPSADALQAIKNAKAALKSGDKRSARQWAERSAALAPYMEDPWLLLAAVSSPRASVQHLKRALAINPQSQQARKGMHWAIQRLKAEQARSPRPAPPTATKPERNRWRPVFLVTLTALTCLALAAVALTSSSPVRAFFEEPVSAAAQNQNWAQVDIVKPTYTVTPSLTPSPTLIPTNTPTATYTPTPTETPISTNTATAVPTKPPVNTAATGKKIVVDISEQRMYVYEGDKLVYSFVVSTGMNNATAAGTFSVLNKIPNAYGSTWNIWMPNWLGIYWAGTLQNGIHALPILPNGGILWDGYLGTPISYGCVVLGTADSKLLFDWAEVGTPVIIQR